MTQKKKSAKKASDKKNVPPAKKKSVAKVVKEQPDAEEKEVAKVVPMNSDWDNKKQALQKNYPELTEDNLTLFDGEQPDSALQRIAGVLNIPVEELKTT